MNVMDAGEFQAHRPMMLAIAYRMLGSMTEAEDIVQEAFLRYQSMPPEQIVSHKAFLSTVVTRLCLNRLESARVQRETYIGPWLPEPVATQADEPSAPQEQAELHESLSLAFLVLLEELTPVERAVFLLREVFDYEYAEIAEIVDKEETACRQIFSRAKKHIAEHRPRFKPNRQAHRALLDQFIRTVSTGDLNGLMGLLAADVTMTADGGGKVRGAATQRLYGQEAVARFLLASTRLAPETFHADVTPVNGEPALTLHWDNDVRLVLSVEINEGKISKVLAIGNPDKLKWVSGPAGHAGEVIE